MKIYKDVNGRESHTNLQGESGITYGNTDLFTPAEIDAMLADGITVFVPPLVPAVELTDEEKLQQIENAVQLHLDTTALAHGYSSIHTAVSYADEPTVAKFQTEGAALRAWRSSVWEACYTMLAEWRAGDRAEMTPAEVVAALPTFVMPE
ncbi:MAG: hypothetical protein RPU60_12945 [Candidatus Sedimenticola sp. (ex Thyasira tokunagai)]